MNGNVIEKHVVNHGARTYAASKGHRQVAMRLGNLSHRRRNLRQNWPGQYKLIPGQGDQSPINGNQ